MVLDPNEFVIIQSESIEALPVAQQQNPKKFNEYVLQQRAEIATLNARAQAITQAKQQCAESARAFWQNLQAHAVARTANAARVKPSEEPHPEAEGEHRRPRRRLPNNA